MVRGALRRAIVGWFCGARAATRLAAARRSLVCYGCLILCEEKAELLAQELAIELKRIEGVREQHGGRRAGGIQSVGNIAGALGDDLEKAAAIFAGQIQSPRVAVHGGDASASERGRRNKIQGQVPRAVRSGGQRRIKISSAADGT